MRRRPRFGAPHVQTVDTSPLEPLLRYLWQASATDLHLAAGTAPRVRVDGNLHVVPDHPELTADFVTSVLDGLMDDADHERFLLERQLDFAFSWDTTARFRANAFFQMDRP